jgi:hypothetical protein
MDTGAFQSFVVAESASYLTTKANALRTAHPAQQMTVNSRDQQMVTVVSEKAPLNLPVSALFEFAARRAAKQSALKVVGWRRLR